MKRIAIALIIFLLLTSLASAATLNVGPKEKYKTIQSAVNVAHNGDTIKVASGTYKETVIIDKSVNFYGTKYPKVNGFEYFGADSDINGFSITKDGVSSDYAGGGTIRNNYFYNCNIDLAGSSSSASSVINNQITGGTIILYETMGEIPIKGNIISKSKCGLYIGDMAGASPVTKNTFKNCQYGVYIYTDKNPGRIPQFSGNKYIKNKVNIGWGTDY
ncbi:NosD domain-containing protein [Methanosarcina sp. UBA5]|uniref:NosD domain-containing protein n=1 Tax=Methanosarcina sp. UBA5 TaxID=1915593 RepID=UPI0025FC1754|nr:NosD domain-containing protein [Methanosarcina sp. UBA5]